MGEAVKIPEKLYFKIGEVSDLTGVKPYVLRYWESEFNIVRPSKTPSNQRLYKRREVELILEIKRLLYEEKFTIAGAKKALVERTKPRVAPRPVAAAPRKPEDVYRQALIELRRRIVAIKELVEDR
ncbi:MerR family transcriptional regulator [bacterium]|nr:MerR family transcriptional regulator [bacterium]